MSTKRGMWEGMRTVVKKRGNGASIRIPSHVLKAAKVEIDDVVDIRAEQGRIVVEPLWPTSYDLADLIRAITPDNLHDKVEFGRPVGKERLLMARHAVRSRRSGSQRTRRSGRA